MKPRIYLYRKDWWRCVSQADAYSFWVADGATPQEAYAEWARSVHK